MNTERWRRIERHFQEAGQMLPVRREAYLEEACRDDPELRSEVARLLDFDQRHDIIDTPVLARHRLGRVPGVAELLDPPSGTMIGPYRLVERIASGGMGVVYRAVRTDELLDFEVAVKLVRRGVESRSIVERFKTERHTLVHLAHANIAHLLDGGTTDDGRPYLVMEFIHGMPIDRFCDERGLSIEERVRLFCVVCRAVHFAHQNLVVHCDLKPPNILVTDDGTPRIVDFGVARVIDRHRRRDVRAAEGDPLGTPDYASPELVAGGPITTATDVYALGVMLYGLLAGRHPARVSGRAWPPDGAPARPSDAVLAEGEGPAPADVAASRGTTPRRLRRRLRGDLDAITLGALDREPTRRYPSTEVLARDLERCLAGRPVSVRSDTVLYRSGKFASRHRNGILPAALVTVVLAVTAISGWRRDATLRDAHVTEVEREMERIRHAHDADPRLQAELLDSMARVLAGFGMEDESRAATLEAEAIRRETPFH